MDKIIKKYERFVRQKVEVGFKKHDFLLSKPQKITSMFSLDELPDKHLRALARFVHNCLKRAADKKTCCMRCFSTSDRGKAVLNFLVLAAPGVVVLTDDGIIRFSCVLLLGKDYLQLSLQQVQTGQNSGAIAGINLSEEELKLAHKSLDLTGQRVWQYSITIDRRSPARINLMQATAWLSAPPADRLATAINALPLPHLFGALHAVLATLMPMLEEDAKPCFFPALRLNEDDAVREMQLEELRRTLGGLAFARDRSGCGPLLPELALQERADIKTLEAVRGIPVLTYVDCNSVQHELTDAMQRAHCELIATGFVKHPLQTLPLLTGAALPAGNVLLALDWPTFTAAAPEDFAALRQAFGSMLHHPEAVTDRLNRAIRRMVLDGRPYAETYLCTAAAVFDELLLGGTAHAGTLTRRVDEMIARHRDQQAEQQRRYDSALANLPGLLTEPDIVAEDVKALRERGGLGFRYTTKDGGKYAAFELGEDFPALLEQLGLRADDSASFREFLLQHDSIREMSRNVRGRSGDSCSHVLITLK